MAFKRLVVHRSPLLVWSGVLASFGWFAWMRAEHIKTFGQLAERMRHGHSWIWALGYALCAYLVFRGLHGAWWRELRVDTGARELKTCTGAVVDLDRIGALAIKDGALVAENVATPLYRGGRSDVRERHDALASVLGTKGRVYLHQLRRLTFHRSWALFTLTLLGFAVLTLAVGGNIVLGGSDELEYKLMAAGGYAVCFAWFRRALFGSFARDQLFVDPVVGVVRLPDGTIQQLADLGALSIVEARAPYDYRRRHQSVTYELRAANVEGVLYASVYQADTKRRLDALEAVTLQHRLRQVLEVPIVEGDAFRAQGIDPTREVARIAGASPYKRAALDGLARDPDPGVRRRALQLR